MANVQNGEEIFPKGSPPEYRAHKGNIRQTTDGFAIAKTPT